MAEQEAIKRNADWEKRIGYPTLIIIAWSMLEHFPSERGCNDNWTRWCSETRRGEETMQIYPSIIRSSSGNDGLIMASGGSSNDS